MTRTRTSMKQTPSTAANDADSATAAEITYTKGTLSEVWIASGKAERFELISLPDPKTSEPRQFVHFIRPDSAGHMRPSLGELRTFETPTPASFLVELAEDCREELGVDNDDQKDQSGSNGAESKIGTEEEESPSRKRVLATKQTLRMVTDIDFAFLLLPVVGPKTDKHGEIRSTFLPFDDVMEAWADMDGSQASRLASDENIKGGMEPDLKEALGRICDSVDAGGENAYRFSLAKFEKLMTDKAFSLVKSGLPASLEDRALKLVDSMVSVVVSANNDSPLDTPTAMGTPGELSVSASETQESTASAVFSQSGDLVPTLSSMPSLVSQTSAGEELESLARMRIALGFIMSNYVPAEISEQIMKRIDEASSNVDFKPLREHVERKRESDRRMEAVRNVSHKRGADDDERMEERAEKKRKLEEEEKKRKAASAGVKALAKVNTKGMQKMSSFFKTKPK